MNTVQIHARPAPGVLAAQIILAGRVIPTGPEFQPVTLELDDRELEQLRTEIAMHGLEKGGRVQLISVEPVPAPEAPVVSASAAEELP